MGQRATPPVLARIRYADQISPNGAKRSCGGPPLSALAGNFSNWHWHPLHDFAPNAVTEWFCPWENDSSASAWKSGGHLIPSRFGSALRARDSMKPRAMVPSGSPRRTRPAGKRPPIRSVRDPVTQSTLGRGAHGPDSDLSTISESTASAFLSVLPHLLRLWLGSYFDLRPSSRRMADTLAYLTMSPMGRQWTRSGSAQNELLHQREPQSTATTPKPESIDLAQCRLPV